MSAEFLLIDAALRPLADPARAAGMSAYQRGRFPFLGVPAPARRAAVKEVLGRCQEAVDRELVEACWTAAEREFQYVACDHLRDAPLRAEDVPWLRTLVVRKSWWDTVDALAKPIGRAATAQQMREWAADGNLWVRRVAILHQLGRREATDTGMLAEIILNNLGSGEFFIDKAIGWALRDFSKTDREWVREFLRAHGAQLSALSRREGSKYV
ncbi:DNA alkylation repair protein [Corynebacterium comes]|uniref:DNA alkylation repair enzyme n=1 Tax=Corynebacterium comes TaxID=2675218 RepID=A0A6B8VFP1_9CORY|nr:DNA alkylation repair protein [Corynebacterium comes]QGU04092.1 DNA alkylation repair enzyme [Corynebacterium comes]